MISANVEQFKNISFGHIFISVHKDNVKSTIKYCDLENIEYKLLDDVCERGENNVF